MQALGGLRLIYCIGLTAWILPGVAYSVGIFVVGNRLRLRLDVDCEGAYLNDQLVIKMRVHVRTGKNNRTTLGAPQGRATR